MGKRIQELERSAGERVDELAKRLLRLRAVRGPAKRLANSQLAWSFASRLDRIRSRRLQDRLKKGPIPHHVGIIMDGNRRFAKILGLTQSSLGHVAGQERLETVLDWCLDLHIRVLTVYAFSTENFLRADSERELLMELFEHNFRKMAKDPRVHKHGIQVRVIGALEMLPQGVQDAAKEVMDATADYDNYHFNVAVAYGGRQEIVDAVKRVAKDVEAGELSADQVDEDAIRSRLYVPDLPDPDFLIRTSGEERISNFLLWQIAYSELYFADVNWPELDRMRFMRAIETYQKRQRRYGR